MKADKHTRKITVDDVNERIKTGVCPCCGDYRLIKMMKIVIVNDSDKDRKFSGSYWACGSEKAHKCYHLSEKECRESTTADEILKENNDCKKSSVVLRKHGK
jgi:hypothetical protein